MNCALNVMKSPTTLDTERVEDMLSGCVTTLKEEWVYKEVSGKKDEY